MMVNWDAIWFSAYADPGVKVGDECSNVEYFIRNTHTFDGDGLCLPLSSFFDNYFWFYTRVNRYIMAVCGHPPSFKFMIFVVGYNESDKNHAAVYGSLYY